VAEVKPLRTRQQLGKYRIERRLATGPRALVYQAYDTIHGVKVALKVPLDLNDEFLDEFRREARLSSRMEHPNVLPIQNACYIDDYFIIAMPLGSETLADRMSRRMSTDLALDYTQQALAAVAHAHARKIIHCDVKPENFIIFEDNRLRLSDFGFSRVAHRTIKASGSGTVGYLAPEQALGRPMFQSDVFSLGLLIYQMFSAKLPEWPYKWPPPGYPRVRAKLTVRMLGWLRKAMEFKPQDRHTNAVAMEREFQQIRTKVVQSGR
jgi:serine/threonine-protein kinase